MPHIAISMYPGRSRERKEDLAVKMQAFLAEELGLDKKIVSVSIEDIEKEKWAEAMSKIPAEAMFVKHG